MKPQRIATKRAILAQAWRVAQMRMTNGGSGELKAGEEAGRLLAKHEVAIAAYALCSYAPARELLEEVVKEEGGDVGPLRRMGR